MGGLSIHQGGTLSKLAPTQRGEVVPATATVVSDAKSLAVMVVTDPIYQNNLLNAARARMLPPAIEVALMYYAWGKPLDRLEVRPVGSLENLSTEELAARAREISSRLEEELLEEGRDIPPPPPLETLQ